jgi:hypothetical protein
MSAVGLVAGQGEEALHAGCGEIDFLVRANGDGTSIGEFLPELCLPWIAGSREFHELQPCHVADRDDVVAVINFDSVFVDTSWLAALTGAQFEVFKFFVIAALRPVGGGVIVCFHSVGIRGSAVLNEPADPAHGRQAFARIGKDQPGGGQSSLP